jgi:hypothetical protein
LTIARSSHGLRELLFRGIVLASELRRLSSVHVIGRIRTAASARRSTVAFAA